MSKSLILCDCMGTQPLDVARIEDELVIGIAGRRRRIALPAGFARLEVERVAVEDAELVVAFGEPDAANGAVP